jgi:hypothetical protein
LSTGDRIDSSLRAKTAARAISHLRKPQEIASNLGNRRRRNPLRQAAFLTIAPIRDLMRAEFIQGRT